MNTGAKVLIGVGVIGGGLLGWFVYKEMVRENRIKKILNNFSYSTDPVKTAALEIVLRSLTDEELKLLILFFEQYHAELNTVSDPVLISRIETLMKKFEQFILN